MIVLSVCEYFVFFFFFQAEDGIRDLTVTGVQTCALPILSLSGPPWRYAIDRPSGLHAGRLSVSGSLSGPSNIVSWRGAARSEERRVGKECRSRWSPYH